jgi:multidrug resistance efflux pump
MLAAQSAGQIASEGKTVTRALHGSESLYGQVPDQHLVMVPLAGAGGVRGYTAFYIETTRPGVLEERRDRLELSASLLSLYEMRLTLQRRQSDLGRLRASMEILATVNDQKKFTAAAMAVCNEISSRWQCLRVGLGLLKGRYVKLKALSDTEKFDRKTEAVQIMESAMEECVDQDLEILYPAPPEATYVCRSAKQLSTRLGPFQVLSLPLRSEGEVVGALSIERPREQEFTAEEVEALRLTCDLCTARLLDLEERDKWFGAKAAGATRKGAAVLVGAKHTWIKLLAIGIIALVLFAVLVKGDYNAEGGFVLEPTVSRVAPAKMKGLLKEVYVKPGSKVVAGETLLAELQTHELKSELGSAKLSLLGYQQTAEVHRRNGDLEKYQVAMSEVRRLELEIAELQRKIDLARIVTPIDGTVVEGDLEELIDKTIEKGQVLFRIASLSELRAEIAVPEDQIADVEAALREARREGEKLTGELAAARRPDDRVTFVVERIHPVATVKEQQNVFLVRARLQSAPEWLRPGMEGTAKIHIGREVYGYIWTRRLVNWIRMKLWW